MASLNLAGKTSGYVKLTAPDDSSTNPTVTLPTESGELSLKVWTEEDGRAVYDGEVRVKKDGNSKFLFYENDGNNQLRIVDLPSTTVNATPNIHCDGAGNLWYSTAVYYTTEEVDKKLAAKDKLIEKLSERLDKLEAKLKK